MLATSDGVEIGLRIESGTSGLKKRCGLFGRDRPTEIIALPLVALVEPQEIELRFCLHSLRYYPLPQALPDIDHGAEDSRVFAARGYLLHERLVESKRVRWKAL